MEIILTLILFIGLYAILRNLDVIKIILVYLKDLVRK